jgi:hypothetical protein
MKRQRHYSVILQELLTQIKVLDINKFKNLVLFTKLITAGLIDSNNRSTLKNFTTKMLKDVLGGKDKEVFIILGKTNWDKAEVFLKKNKNKDLELSIGDISALIKLLKLTDEIQKQKLTAVMTGVEEDYKAILERLEKVNETSSIIIPICQKYRTYLT